ncbi:snRNA-activating protein complex subunit isoform X2 [Mercurialis annua]|uniref:snRNA-activating protein complex subunit isoform X2 n=1 Tax=Mercurialis annua TaxID=3986 RepID=UPI00215E8E32|nr:snRNA-activating protein complex subunit isoform X2 [Mercurialis annua]
MSDDETIAIARGGPIYIPNSVGPLTRVPEFESALLCELQDLKHELSFDASFSSVCNDNDDVDLSVDDIKPFTDEDLVEMALNDETFHPPLIDKETNENSFHPSKEPFNLRENNDIVSHQTNAHLESSRRGEDPSPSPDLLNEENCCNGTIVSQKSRKRKLSSKSSDGPRATTRSNGAATRNTTRKSKGRKENKHALDEGCLAKVGELLKIKEKQDQEKAASRLHSLNCKISKSLVPFSEKSESLKYLRSTHVEKQLKHPNVQEHVALQHPEFVLSVEIYHNIRNWIKTQEFLVLGRQTLTEMRDKIYCMTDQVMQKAQQHDPSGYFLVEDVFCNDLRDPSATDYSAPIFDWLRNSKDEALSKWECIIGGELRRKHKTALGQLPTSRLPQFRRVDMQKTRFCDLRFRLGSGYLYCHQGDCKHTIIIRDMRLVHPEDVQNRAAYPITTFQLKPRVRKCDICGIFRPKKVTVDDKWTPHNPCYFCEDCYFHLHYNNETGSLLYNHLAYDYLHDLPE